LAATVLIDTDILIDAGRGVKEPVDCLQHQTQEGAPAISVVTQMELIVGCRDKQEFQKVKKFLNRFEIISLDAQSSDIAVNLLVKYRLSHGLLIPDALIAASAMASGLPLLSKNQRDYRFINGLNLLAYP